VRAGGIPPCPAAVVQLSQPVPVHALGVISQSVCLRPEGARLQDAERGSRRGGPPDLGQRRGRCIVALLQGRYPLLYGRPGAVDRCCSDLSAADRDNREAGPAGSRSVGSRVWAGCIVRRPIKLTGRSGTAVSERAPAGRIAPVIRAGYTTRHCAGYNRPLGRLWQVLHLFLAFLGAYPRGGPHLCRR